MNDYIYLYKIPHRYRQENVFAVFSFSRYVVPMVCPHKSASLVNIYQGRKFMGKNPHSFSDKTRNPKRTQAPALKSKM